MHKLDSTYHNLVTQVVEHWVERNIHWVDPSRKTDPTTYLTSSERSTTELRPTPHLPKILRVSGVTESLYGGQRGTRPSSGGRRGRHRNEGCTIKSQMGGGGSWCEWEGMAPSPHPHPPPQVTPPLRASDLTIPPLGLPYFFS